MTSGKNLNTQVLGHGLQSKLKFNIHMSMILHQLRADRREEEEVLTGLKLPRIFYQQRNYFQILILVIYLLIQMDF